LNQLDTDPVFLIL